MIKTSTLLTAITTMFVGAICHAEITVTSTATLVAFGGDPDSDNLDGTPIVFETTFPPGAVWEDSTFGQPGIKAVAPSATLTFNGTPVVFNAGELPLSYVHINSDPDNLRRGIFDGNGSFTLNFSVFGDSSVNSAAGVTGTDEVINIGDPVQVENFTDESPFTRHLSQIQFLNGSFYNMTDHNLTVTEVIPPGILGDVNCDGFVNLLDVSPFIDLISTGQFSDKADINQDGFVNLLDVAPFIFLLSGG